MSSAARLLLTPPARIDARAVLGCVAVAAIHVGAVAAIVRRGTPGLAALAGVLYAVRMVALSAGYHRYFTHRAYRTSRAFQLVLALLGTTAMQKGPLWWASMDRLHHRHADTERDVHSPLCRGLAWSHAGWWLSRKHEAPRLDLVPDLAGYPELRWVDRWSALGPLALAAVLFLAGGLDALLWGFALSTCLVLHASGTIGSLAHRFGTRRYATREGSRNNALLAILTFGEGWHNNHHHYPNSARQGFLRWEVDLTYALLVLLSKLGLVWDLRGVPAHALRRHRLDAVGERCPLLGRPSAAWAWPWTA